MQIIPVIDIKDGQVVHAAGGDRSCYQPIHLNSKLCNSSKLEDVITAFLSLHPFDTFYIADLNAIIDNGDHAEAIDTLLNDHPHLEFWIDNGSDAQTQSTLQLKNHKPVVGTESQACACSLTGDKQILSLDFKHNRPLGHPEWLENPNLWPETIIVMTLDLVGSGKGPDFQTLASLIDHFPDKNFVAAGGIRNIDDLLKLEEIGVSAALIASCLHNGVVTGVDIKKLDAKKIPRQAGVFLTTYEAND